MTDKHTPGPWKAQSHQRASLAEASVEIESKSGRTICDMGDYPNDEDRANARLIASAPEMMELLKRAVSPSLTGDNYQPSIIWYNEARTLISRINPKGDTQ